MMHSSDWDFDLDFQRKCPFCAKQMTVRCDCGAYLVFEDTYNLPLKRQPYMQ